MASHMKTTVHIADAVLAQAQALAARDNTTLKALIDEGLRHVVAKRAKPGTFKLRDASVGGAGLNPEFQNASWEDIRALVYEGRGG